MKITKLNPISPMLVNTEEMNRQNPETFHLPENRASLIAGNYAKICCNGERFWTKILAVEDGTYVGEVVNQLVVPANKPLIYGSLVRFAPCNVFEAADGGVGELIGFPAGTYWVCDPCFAWPESVCEEFLRPVWEQVKNGLPQVIDVDGGKIFMWFASSGDGVYPMYGPKEGAILVDSGTIAIIPVALIRKWRTKQKLLAMEKDDVAISLKMNEAFEIVHEDGNAFFGEYCVDTSRSLMED
jgi:hypothetical protein